MTRPTHGVNPSTQGNLPALARFTDLMIAPFKKASAQQTKVPQRYIPSSWRTDVPSPLTPRSSTARRISVTDSCDAAQYSKAIASTGLFSKLPTEIRDLIWRHAVDGKVVHLWISERRLKGFICSSDQPLGTAKCFMKCWKEQFEGDERVGVWGLILSCRALYTELIDRLYANTLFMTSSRGSLAYLPILVPAQRIHSITNIFFRWSLSNPPTISRRTRQRLTAAQIGILRARGQDDYLDMWFRVWETLREMEGLKRVVIQLRIGGIGWTRSDLDLVEKLKSGNKVILVAPLGFLSVVRGEDEELEEERNYLLRSSLPAEWDAGMV